MIESNIDLVLRLKREAIENDAAHRVSELKYKQQEALINTSLSLFTAQMSFSILSLAYAGMKQRDD